MESKSARSEESIFKPQTSSFRETGASRSYCHFPSLSPRGTSGERVGERGRFALSNVWFEEWRHARNAWQKNSKLQTPNVTAFRMLSWSLELESSLKFEA